MSTRDEDKRLTVPKFSSFKSSEPAPEPRGKDDKPRSKDRDSRSKRHRSDKHHHSSRRHESPHNDRKRSRSPKRKDTRQVELRPALESVSMSGVFIIDTKGDPLISKYGGIERSKIPSYRRYGGGKVMGTAGWLNVHRDGPRDQFSIRMPAEGSSLREKDGLRTKRLRFTPQPVKLRRKVEDDEEEAKGEFLSVNSRKRKRGQDSASSSDEEQLPAYRAIEGKAKTDPDLDSDEESDSDASIHVPDLSDPLKQTSMQLNRRVKDHPDDIDAWIELANHQDTLLKASDSVDRSALEAEAHSYAEIKVSMLESALSNTSTPHDRSRVLVYLMREGVKVWSSKTAATKWAEVSKDEEDNFMLWRTRLDFSMSSIASFQYDELRTMLMTRLRGVLSRSKPEPSRDDIEEAIYLFLRTTRFIHDAGYKELAVAAWQSLLELNLFRPSKLDGNASLDDFQDFWESEVPRLGDEDAQGWRQYVDSGGAGDAPEPLRKDKSEERHSNDTYRAWGETERLRSQKSRVPARTMDEGTEDDPYRVVMYSDIESVLFSIPATQLPHVTPQLIDAFLLFCGLPTAFQPNDWTDMACHDQFLTAPWGSIRDRPSWEITVEDMEETTRRPPPFSEGEVHASISSDLLFSGGTWFRYLAAQNPGHAIDRAWVQAAMRQLVHVAEVKDLAPLFMALCFFEDPTNIRKPSKALLKKYPASVELYTGYAMCEYSNGKPEVASTVLRSAMNVALTSEKADSFLFWRIWSWMELEMGSLANATKRLCSSVDESLRKTPDDDAKVSSTYILKAQQFFLSGFHESLAAGDVDGAGSLVECIALLSYLTADGCTEPTSGSQGNISAAMFAVEAVSQEMKAWRYSHSVAHERVLQFAAKLLYFNASKGPFRRGYMQEQLSRFIEFFPRNTILLSLFEWSDSSLRVVDETRSLVHDKVLSSSQDCISSRVFAIRHELTRGNANSTKAAFEHAVASDTCKASVSLWVSYIRFSASQTSLRGKAKDVFYRALRRCPGSKEVMMEAFGTLDKVMGKEELRAVYDTMVSKGLRIHVDLEEFVERRRAGTVSTVRKR